MAEYSQGVCGDGAAILRDGQRMTVDEIVAELNAADAVRKERAALYLRARDWAELSGRMEAERDALRSLAAAMYQAAGAYGMPVRFLDVLSAAGNGEAITPAQVDALLPCETPDHLAERDALQARIDGAPVGQSLGMVVYYADGSESAAAKAEGKRVALVVLEDGK